MTAIPERPSLDGLEAKWDSAWQAGSTYVFDRTAERVYSIDTPPPTVSGRLHLGTVFGYVPVDAIARYRRMGGHAVFYPMGWDDNGLPTERRVQQYFGVYCDPDLPYDPDLTVERGDHHRGHPVSRQNFVELCRQLTAEFEADFEHQWRRLGLSVDWSLTYATIDDRGRRTAQLGFLRNLARGQAYLDDAPTMWDVDFQTAVAQAELVDRAVESAYHRLRFRAADGGDPLDVDTTRPELLAACVGLVVHPGDERYAHLVGRRFVSPLFGVEVPVLTHPLAEQATGTGVVMTCTFGDRWDAIWWRELGLPIRSVIGRDGRFPATVPDWLTGPGADAYAELAGATVAQARLRTVELLAAAGEQLGPARPITHHVSFYEKGDRPLEIVTGRQWYLANGAHRPELRAALLARGAELSWHPESMRRRYEHWVDGLNTDWLISRQRFFGVPFPVWYPVDAAGRVDHDHPLLADEADLPVDPQADPPPGFDPALRGRPGGFVGDPDVMDTWATSSLSPQLIGGWPDDELFDRVFPMDLRPQGPEIIRTWLFSSVLRSHLEHGVLPWRHTLINGWVLDPHHKKLSKSDGNALAPDPFLAEFGADAVRYWACRAAPGTDTAVDRGQFKIGRRLAVKLLNAARFVLGVAGAADPDPSEVTQPLDRALLARLAEVVDAATGAFEGYAHHRALDRTETFFWTFCDDYLELVKQRALGGDSSARSTLAIALDVLVRLFAPVLPFVTEEVWSWWRAGSVHRAPWPDPAELRPATAGADPGVLDAVRGVLVEIRRAKTTGKRSQRSGVARLTVAGPAQRLHRVRQAAVDLRNAGHVADLVLVEAAEPAVGIRLAPVG